jgi:hypothetical protein
VTCAHKAERDIRFAPIQIEQVVRDQNCQAYVPTPIAEFDQVGTKYSAQVYDKDQCNGGGDKVAYEKAPGFIDATIGELQLVACRSWPQSPAR